MRRPTPITLLALVAGCGLEADLFAGTLHEPPPPPANLTLTAKLTPLKGGEIAVRLLDGGGNEVRALNDALVVDAGGGTPGLFAVLRGGNAYVNLRVAAVAGTVLVKTLAPRLDDAHASADAGAADLDSTVATLLLEAKVSAVGRTLAQVPSSALLKAFGGIGKDLSVATPPPDSAAALAQRVFAMAKVLASLTSIARTGAVPFAVPVLDRTGKTIISGLSAEFLARAIRDGVDYNRDGRIADDERRIDYDGDGIADVDTSAFDRAVEAAAAKISIPVCLDPKRIRVVFQANFNPGQKDANCVEIDRFAWAKNEPGRRVFFAGGVHKDSPLQGQAIDGILGGWVPNRIPMYDDGTHADAAANDGNWTVTFDLPSCQGSSCLRIGYKTTWGRAGDNWGGTEEWPGNQRLLEIRDVARYLQLHGGQTRTLDVADGLVVRADNFGDETTNKDKANMLAPALGGRGTVTWDTDADKDGIPDAQERPVDTDADCRTDAWPDPGPVEPLTVECP